MKDTELDAAWKSAIYNARRADKAEKQVVLLKRKLAEIKSKLADAEAALKECSTGETTPVSNGGVSETTYLSKDSNHWTQRTNNMVYDYLGDKNRWIAVGKKVKVTAKEPKMRGRR